MATKLQIINGALARLGITPISSAELTLAEADPTTANTEAGQLVGNTYDNFRDQLIQSHPWNFSTVTTHLAPSTNVPIPPGWTTVWALPSDYIRLLEVLAVDDTAWSVESFSSTAGPQLLLNTTGNTVSLQDSGSLTWASGGTKTVTRSIGSFLNDGYVVGQSITVSGSGEIADDEVLLVTVVTSNVLTFTTDTSPSGTDAVGHDVKLPTNNIAVKYIAKVTDTTKYSPGFIDAFMSKLAAEWAEPLTSSNATIDRMEAQRARKIREVRSFEGQEGSPKIQQHYAWIQER